ncbi:MAG: tetratricopeptide repeat protein [Pirellulales bacterium]|nr:tetratricopeptide repeat protein [Pirellulales bacterium]
MTRTRLKWLLATGLMVVTVGLFGRMVWDKHDFVNYDDHLYVTRNDDVQQGLSFWGVLRSFDLRSTVAANWHPLTMITHMADCSMWGVKPWGHHFNNLVLHTFNVVLLFLVFARMTGQIWPSALLAALFSWHPLHVESVAWASERKDVLSALFWLLTMWAYTRYVERPSLAKYASMALLLVLGLLSKPMVVTLPCVLLLLDLWPLNRLGGANLFTVEGFGKAAQRLPLLLLEKLPLFALVAMASVITFIAQRSQSAVAPLEAIPISVRLVNSLMSYSAYVSSTLWPVDLAIPYPLDTRELTVLQAALAFVGACLITLVTAMLFRWAPYLLVGWLWYLGTLVPVIGFVQVGSQYMADRYTYIPLIGVFAALAFGLADLLDSSKRVPAWAFVPIWLLATALPAMAVLTEYGRRAGEPVPVTWLLATLGGLFLLALLFGLLASRVRTAGIWGAGAGAGFVLASLGVLTYWQVGYWKDTLHLFGHTVLVTPRNHGAYFGLGTAYWQEGNLDKALEMFETSLKIGPNLSMGRYNRALALGAAKEYERAIREFEIAMRCGTPERSGRLEIGRTYLFMRRWEDAKRQFTRVLEIDPDDHSAHSNLGIALMQLGQTDAAVAQYQQAVAGDRADPRAAVLLSRVYATHPNPKYRDPDKALALAKNSCRLTQMRNALALDTLAAAYAAKKDYEQARHFAMKAKQRAYFDKEDDFALEIEKRYRLYSANRPYIEDPLNFDPLRT